MSRVCTICNHPKRKKIDKRIIEGEPYRRIATHFEISEPAVRRHKAHLNGTLLKAKEYDEIAHADNLLDQVKKLQEEALDILNKAKKKDHRTALMAIREARGCCELLGKLLGQLREGPTINILISPEWIELRTIILEALEPYPEAKITVSRALESLTNGNSA